MSTENVGVVCPKLSKKLLKEFLETRSVESPINGHLTVTFEYCESLGKRIVELELLNHQLKRKLETLECENKKFKRNVEDTWHRFKEEVISVKEIEDIVKQASTVQQKQFEHHLDVVRCVVQALHKAGCIVSSKEVRDIVEEEFKARGDSSEDEESGVAGSPSSREEEEEEEGEEEENFDDMPELTSECEEKESGVVKVEAVKAGGIF